MAEHTSEGVASPDLEIFAQLAREGNWSEFDRRVLDVSNDTSYTNWALSGLGETDESLRDLATSILEHTGQEISGSQLQALATVRDADQSLHLRRKAAIALYVKGDTSHETISSLHDAFLHDSELREQVGKLLNIDEVPTA